MNARFRSIFIGFVTLFSVQTILAQPQGPTANDPGITANGAIGEIKAIDLPSRQLIVKTDAGSLVIVNVVDNATYLRLTPGETSLDKATKIALTDLAEGDRVFARGAPAEDRKSVSSKVVIVMSKADIAKKHEEERADWRRRGILGEITSLNPATKEITISSRTMAGMQAVVIPIADKVELRRYAPDSIKFSDAKVSNFEELKVGDQLRALGERSADGKSFTAEKVVTGSFRTVAGTVTAVDAATGQLTISDLEKKQPLTIVVKQDAVLRRFPPVAELGGMFGRGAGGPAGGAQGQQAGGPGQAQAQGTRQGGPGGGGGRFNVQEMLERLPTISIADLKAGDTIVVSSTKGADASRLTAITLVSGADTLLSIMAARQQQAGIQGPPNPANLGGAFQIGLP